MNGEAIQEKAPPDGAGRKTRNADDSTTAAARLQGHCLDWDDEINEAPARDGPDEGEERDGGEERQDNEGEPRSRPRGGAWTAIADADADKLRRRCPERFGRLISVWVVLMREARFRRSLTVELSRSVIADRASIGDRNVEYSLQLLKSFGMLTWKAERNRSTGKYNTRKITLKPAVSPCAISDKNAQGHRVQSPCAPEGGASSAQTDTTSRGLKPPLDDCNRNIPSPVYSGGERYAPPRTREGSSEGTAQGEKVRIWKPGEYPIEGRTP